MELESSAVPNQFGIFFHGPNQSQVTFGNGFLCVTGSIVRGAVVMAAGNAATYVYDSSDAQHSLHAYVGNTRHFRALLKLHFTPTYSSWLNQVELWFAKIERDVIARGVFTSVSDLKRKLMRYIRHYNKAPRTVKWRYFDPALRITSKSAVTVH